ncbi:hypothetical protein ACPWSR_15995 [Alloiococcus sp. CFN-8]|uniref:hypothetical protein n=1 Tax=Alloiococcus sp. CFN-8 TaxID=3416081 RepID=UPI003CEC8EFC
MKKKIIIAVAIFALALIFPISYYVTRGLLERQDNKVIETSRMNQEELLPTTKIILKAIEDKTGMLMEYKSLSLKDFADEKHSENKSIYTTKANLVEYLKTTGYKLEEDNGQEIVFTKIKDKGYEEGKYYLGVNEEGYICIYRAINTSNLTIEKPEEDISGRKIEELQEYERTKLITNSFSFSTREEALDALSEYDS